MKVSRKPRKRVRLFEEVETFEELPKREIKYPVTPTFMADGRLSCNVCSRIWERSESSGCKKCMKAARLNIKKYSKPRRKRIKL